MVCARIEELEHCWQVLAKVDQAVAENICGESFAIFAHIHLTACTCLCGMRFLLSNLTERAITVTNVDRFFLKVCFALLAQSSVKIIATDANVNVNYEFIQFRVMKHLYCV